MQLQSIMQSNFFKESVNDFDEYTRYPGELQPLFEACLDDKKQQFEPEILQHIQQIFSVNFAQRSQSIEQYYEVLRTRLGSLSSDKQRVTLMKASLIAHHCIEKEQSDKLFTESLRGSTFFQNLSKKYRHSVLSRKQNDHIENILETINGLYNVDGSETVPETIKRDLIIIASLIGCATLSSQGFRRGALFGVASFCLDPLITRITNIVLKMIDKSSRGADESADDFAPLHHPYICILGAPICEEIKDRFVIQSLAKRIMVFTLPASPIFMRGCSIHPSTIGAVTLSSIWFGFGHLSNNTSTGEGINKFYGIATAIAGIELGTIFANYGLLTAIGMHVIHNALYTLENYYDYKKIEKS